LPGDARGEKIARLHSVNKRIMERVFQTALRHDVETVFPRRRWCIGSSSCSRASDASLLMPRASRLR